MIRARTLAGALAALGATAAAAIPAQALQSGHAAARHSVTLKNVRFHPGTLTIKRDDTVTWLWRDGSIAHNVTGGGFKSRTMSKGSFTVRFSRKGTFNYHCTIHVSFGMKGKIVVR
ncbi:MAG TPA: plastocyanin/azurin family copper-binding protein [Solirubrobacteraceae bacterium]|nr:plastocyanin/azurin family copper-binding protein [Solirubrobacteraceae bacterium]